MRKHLARIYSSLFMHPRSKPSIRPEAIVIITEYLVFVGLATLISGLILPNFVFGSVPLQSKPCTTLPCTANSTGLEFMRRTLICGAPFFLLGGFIMLVAVNFYAMKKWAYPCADVLLRMGGRGLNLIQTQYTLQELLHQEEVRKAFGQPKRKHSE